MHILDTDTLTHLYAGHQHIINHLVTRNIRHFRQIPNLKLVNWVDAD